MDEPKTERDATLGLATPADGDATQAFGGTPPDPEATIAHPRQASGTPGCDRAAPDPAVERFRVVRPLARGGLGEVFVAIDGQLRREVALKEIQDRHADDPVSRSRFLLEAEVTGRLEHPGIVPIYGLGRRPDGRLYYAMRLIRGETLREAIERYHAGRAGARDPGERVLALRRLLGRFLETCQAIAYAHEQGVLHRDIKPQNIMLGPHGETLVLDWGLAKLVGDRTAVPDADGAEAAADALADAGATVAGSSIGTPAYMSPEQARGEVDRLGPASDIYSLGATLYEILTGRPPIEEPTLGRLLERARQADVRPPRAVDRTVPRLLQAICLKAMAPQPGDRYATATGLAEDLERWMAGEPVSAHREGLFPRLWRWTRQRPLLAGYLAALVAIDGLLLMLVAIAALTYWTSVDFRPYVVLVYALAELAFATPIYAVLLSQVTLLIGAVLGGLIGLRRGDFRGGLRRGAVRGAQIGLVIGALLALAVILSRWPETIEKIQTTIPQ